MPKKFKGTYYKHQIGNTTACIIEGCASSGNFLQIITNEKTFQFDEFSGCSFSKAGINLDLPAIKGKIVYTNLTPLHSDIMGFFRFFPMQCRHTIVSMYHRLSGELEIDGNRIDFTGGVGYIEGDSGRSFPKEYLWIHCNDFNEKCSITASVADIPFWGFHFRGCICAIIFREKEYRLATYNGVKIEEISKNKLVLTQKTLRLEVEIEGQIFHALKMPINGMMSATVHESNSTYGRFKFFKKNQLLFDFSSNNTSFEYHF